MLIGEEPGGANGPNYDDSKGYAPREKRDYPEERWATVDEHHPRSGPSEISIVESSRIDPVLFKHIEGYTNDSSDSNSTPYYTNTKNLKNPWPRLWDFIGKGSTVFAVPGLRRRE